MTGLATPLEYDVHKDLCDYVRLQWPRSIFNSDGAGNKLSKAQAGMSKMLRWAPGWPDWFLAEARGIYHGLFIEVKRPGTKVWRDNGDAFTEHYQQQEDMIKALRERGFAADFAIGFDEGKAIIDWYMALPAVVA